MKIFDKIKNIINCKELNAGKINGSSIEAMTVGADIIAINNELGHFEIGNNVGKNFTLDIDKYTLIFKGGILVDIKEKGE